jgi:hypothetical protein
MIALTQALFGLAALSLFPALGLADTPPVDPATLYRSLTLKVRAQGSFKVPMPNGADMPFSYKLAFGAPLFSQALFSDFFMGPDTTQFVRDFWDKIALQDGSYLMLGNDPVPLTCIFIRGDDNRFAHKDTPLIPDFLLRVYLVANDFSCTGPINPGWPGNGGRKETWDTYLYFEVRDPTIMLPTETKVRVRWNELPAVFVDQGGNQP